MTGGIRVDLLGEQVTPRLLTVGSTVYISTTKGERGNQTTPLGQGISDTGLYLSLSEERRSMVPWSRKSASSMST